MQLGEGDTVYYGGVRHLARTFAFSPLVLKLLDGDSSQKVMCSRAILLAALPEARS